MASGDTLAVFTPQHGIPPDTNFATFDAFVGAANHAIMVLDFDTTTAESVDFLFIMPAHYTSSANLDVHVIWTCNTAGGTDGVIWTVLFKPITPDVDDLDSVAYGATQDFAESDPASVSGEAVKVSLTGITFSAAGSPLAGELVYIRLTRAVANANDTPGEDAEFLGMEIAEA